MAVTDGVLPIAIANANLIGETGDHHHVAARL
jgi:hypothetical protein